MPHIKRRLSHLFSLRQFEKKQLLYGSEESELFIKIVTNPMKDVVPIGKGEAAALVLAKVFKGIIASNNIKDILCYVKLWKLESVTTADILVEARHMGLIDEYDGNNIWENMLAKKRSLLANSFSEYIRSSGKNGVF